MPERRNKSHTQLFVQLLFSRPGTGLKPRTKGKRLPMILAAVVALGRNLHWNSFILQLVQINSLSLVVRQKKHLLKRKNNITGGDVVYKTAI